MILNKEELLKINGGAAITASLINAISRGITTLLNLGRSVGDAIRRISAGKVCSL